MAAFIKFGDIKGESVDDKHEGWVDVLSFTQPITRPIAEGRAGASRNRSTALLGDVKITKILDKASPKLAEAVCEGTNFPTVHIHFVSSIEGKRCTYVSWELTNVKVTLFDLSISGDEEAEPVEEVSMNFEKIKMTYTEYDKEGGSKGDVDYMWNVEKGARS